MKGTLKYTVKRLTPIRHGGFVLPYRKRTGYPSSVTKMCSRTKLTKPVERLYAYKVAPANQRKFGKQAFNFDAMQGLVNPSHNRNKVNGVQPSLAQNPEGVATLWLCAMRRSLSRGVQQLDTTPLSHQSGTTGLTAPTTLAGLVASIRQ